MPPGSSARTTWATRTSSCRPCTADQFFGNLYHLNAEEGPELPNWPPASDFPHFRERFGPRGVIHSWATEEDDPTEEGGGAGSAGSASRTPAR